MNQPERIDLERFRVEAERLADELDPGDSHLMALSDAEGVEDPLEMLTSFGHETMLETVDAAMKNHPPAVVGIPMFCALVVGMRIGRMQAAKAFEEATNEGGSE